MRKLNPLSHGFCRALLLIFLTIITTSSYASPPSIALLSPNFGPAGTTVTISGANFGSDPFDNVVYFGGVRATKLARPGIFEATRDALSISPIA